MKFQSLIASLPKFLKVFVLLACAGVLSLDLLYPHNLAADPFMAKSIQITASNASDFFALNVVHGKRKVYCHKQSTRFQSGPVKLNANGKTSWTSFSQLIAEQKAKVKATGVGQAKYLKLRKVRREFNLLCAAGPGVETTPTPTSTPAASPSMTATPAPTSTPVPTTTITPTPTPVPVPVRFLPSVLINSYSPGAERLINPTTLALGPDGRLYVGQQNGLIHAFTLDTNHKVIDIEVIEAIYNYPTLNNDGSPATGVTGRQVTGLYVDPDSDPEAPVIYVAHSDPRIGANNDALALTIDTDGGVLSRLTGPDFNTPAQREDLVTGLPRSRENHAPNGIQIGKDGWLYLAIGGNTNYGAPSTYFSDLPEVNLSAAVVRLNLSAFVSTIDVSAGSQVGSIIGDGEIPGLFEVYASGYRNGYDILWHSNGKLYLNGNAGNDGLGNTPGAADGCPEAQSINPGSLPDSLNVVNAGVYGGHPVPARGHCIYGNGSLYTPNLPQDSAYAAPVFEYSNSASTNGLDEYRSQAFGGQLQGNIISVSTFSGYNVRSLKLNATGNSVQQESILASNLSGPIDVYVHQDGSIFVAEFFSNAITLLTPDESGTVEDNDDDGIPDASDPDDDNDSYSDLDEAANTTDPMNPADRPADFDQDSISDLSDPDDDNDGILDTADQFNFDAVNGADTIPPLNFEYNPGDPALGKLRNTGFTGRLLNTAGNAYEPGLISAGAAGGFLSIIPTTGELEGSKNSQTNALQIGINSSSTGVGPFRFSTRVTDPFSSPPAPPLGSEAAGIFLAIDQDNYIRLAVTGDTGSGADGIQLSAEIDGVLTANILAPVPLTLPGPVSVELFLAVDPLTQAISARYRIDSSDVENIVTLGTLNSGNLSGIARFFTPSLGIGLLGTRAEASSSGFVAVFDYFRLAAGLNEPLAASGAGAFIDIDPDGDILGASTYSPGSIVINNTSSTNRKITKVLLDLSTAVLPDVVFDPNAVAGDLVGKAFSVDSNTNTGLLGHQMLLPNGLGYSAIELTFNNFDPGESLSFSIDIDPTSIQGAAQPGPHESGSISGFELSGATTTVYFDNGEVLSSRLFRSIGSNIAAEATLNSSPLTVPSIQALNISAIPSEVSNANQTIRLTGTVGSNVRLVIAEAGLYLGGVPNGGYDIDPFEANNFIKVTELVGTIGSSGLLDLPVSLSKTDSESGLNYIFAATTNGNITSPPSNRIILKLQ